MLNVLEILPKPISACPLNSRRFQKTLFFASFAVSKLVKQSDWTIFHRGYLKMPHVLSQSLFFIIIIINGLGYTPSQKIELWCVYKISTLHIFTYIKN